MSAPEPVWQIACGERNGRDYSRLFFEHGVMLLGPGRYGPYSRQRYEDGPGSRDFPARKISMIRAFAERVKAGHLVVARLGRRAVAVGRVVDRYQHLKQFDDVYGWDLQHTWRVNWFRLPGIGRSVFAQPRGPAFAQVNQGHIRKFVIRCASSIRATKPRRLPPPPTACLGSRELARSLGGAGMDQNRAKKVAAGIAGSARLLRWYEHGQPKEKRQRPSENEVVAHIVIPILRALGWKPESLAVEWRRVDLAVFKGRSEDPADCRMVCEAKRKGRPLGQVLEQAIRYCRTHALVHCRRILITDGEVFHLYRRLGAEWKEKPSGYIHLRKVRRQNLLPSGADAIDTLMALTPERAGG